MDVSVNGHRIQELRITNVSERVRGHCIYRWELLGSNSAVAEHGYLIHHRERGAMELVSRVTAAASALTKVGVPQQ